MKNNILKTRYPIIQAPMNWVTDAQLVSSVSNAGGLGVLGTNAGLNQPIVDPNEVGYHMQREIKKTKALTQFPFGINILTPDNNESLADSPYTKALLNAAFTEKMHYYVVVGFAHEETFNLIKQHDGFIIFRPLTPTIESVQLGEKLGADLIVATGHDEGGVLPENELGTFSVIPEIVDHVSIPVFAAGGINDYRGVQAAFALGAAGVYVGTRFLTAQESPASNNVKELIINSSSKNTVMVSENQRSIVTPRAQKFANDFITSNDSAKINQAISKDGGLRQSMLLGNLDHGIVTVNNAIDTIKKIEPVAEIINQLFKIK